MAVECVGMMYALFVVFSRVSLVGGFQMKMGGVKDSVKTAHSKLIRRWQVVERT